MSDVNAGRLLFALRSLGASRLGVSWSRALNQSHRQQVIEHIKLLAHPFEQLAYEKNVPIANVPAELVCGFCDDLYHPKSVAFINAFSEPELKRLAELYGLLCAAARTNAKSVKELMKSPPWRTAINYAKQLYDHYSREA